MLRVMALTVLYTPGAIITADLLGDRGADIICWNCSMLSGGANIVWVWEVKPANADGMRDGPADLKKHIAEISYQYGVIAIAGKMFDFPQVGQNNMYEYQKVVVASHSRGLELYATSRDDDENNKSRQRREAIAFQAKKVTTKVTNHSQKPVADKLSQRQARSADFKAAQEVQYANTGYKPWMMYCGCNDAVTAVPFYQDPVWYGTIAFVSYGGAIAIGATASSASAVAMASFIGRLVLAA
jgi:hypothetical protein